MGSLLSRYYRNSVLAYPLATVFLCAAFILFLAYHISDFRLDASGDTLVLENDQSLKEYNLIKQQYGSDEFLVITYTPRQELMIAGVVIANVRKYR